MCYWVNEHGESKFSNLVCLDCEEEWEGRKEQWVQCPACDAIYEHHEYEDSIFSKESTKKALDKIQYKSSYLDLDYSEEDYKTYKYSDDSRDTLGLDKFIESSDLNLYRLNPFRVLGLPVFVTAREIARHTDKIKLKLNITDKTTFTGDILPIDPEPNVEIINSSVQYLNDPVSQIIFELFWFWPIEMEWSSSDPGIDELKKRNIKKCADIWSSGLNKKENYDISLHNLAVLYQLFALDFEWKYLNGNLTQKETELRDVYWNRSYKLWDSLTKQDLFWEKYLHRIIKLGDPRVKPSVVKKIRLEIPLVIMLINAKLAVAYAEKGNDFDVKRHLQIIRSSNFNNQIINRSLEISTRSLVKNLSLICEKAKEDIKNSHNEISTIINDLFDKGFSILSIIDTFFQNDATIRNSSHDLLASAGNLCVSYYANETKNYDESIELYKRLLSISIGLVLKDRIKENIEITEANIDESIIEKLSRLCTEIIEAVSKQYGYIDEQREKLEKEGWPIVNEILNKRGKSSISYQNVNQIYCITLCQIALALNNRDQNYNEALAILNNAKEICTDLKTLENIEEGIETISRNIQIEKRNKEAEKNKYISYAVSFAIFVLIAALGGICNDNNAGKQYRRSTYPSYSKSYNSTEKTYNYSQPARPQLEYFTKQELKKAQMCLNILGYHCGSPDGVWGKKSKESFKLFLNANGYSSTGLRNNTYKALLRKGKDKYEDTFNKLTNEVQSYKRRLNILENEIREMEKNLILGIYVNEYTYKSKIEQYNRIVNNHNAKIKYGKKILNEYQQIFN